MQLRLCKIFCLISFAVATSGCISHRSALKAPVEMCLLDGNKMMLDCETREHTKVVRPVMQGNGDVCMPVMDFKALTESCFK